LHVIDRRLDDAIHRYLDDQKLQEFKRRKLEETKECLGEVEKDLKQVGLRVKGRIEVGIPMTEILRVEEDEKVSAVVIGSHGISNLAEIFLGSVSEKVIRRCKTPVLVIKR
jgi:nucleotide-binding universal stress UspA family protein